MFENSLVGFVGVMVTVAGSVWTLAWWLSGHFSAIRKDIIALGKELLDKLEYHERHDDQRFSQVRDDIWDMRVRAAASEGLIPVKK